MSAPSTTNNGWDLVRRGPFSRLFWAGFISSTGDWAALFAQITLAERFAGSTGILVVLSARLLPGLVGGAIGGVLADRSSRKQAIVGADIGRGVLVLSLAFVTNLGSLFAVSVFLELLTLLGQPARAAVVPELVAEDQLIAANSLTLGAAYGTFPLGAGIAWVLGLLPAVTVWGLLPNKIESNIFGFDAISFVLSGLLVATIPILPIREKVKRKDRDPDANGPIRDLLDGISFVAKDSTVRPIVLGMSAALFGGGMLIVLGSGYAANTLNADNAGFFALLTALGTGAGVGIVALSILGDRVERRDFVFGVGMTTAGVGMCASSVIDTISGGMGWLFVMGMGSGAAYVTGFTHLHENVSNELRGRTFAALFSLMRISLLVSMAVAAPLAAVLDGTLPSPFDNSARVLLFTGGLIVLSSGALVLWSQRRHLHPRVSPMGLRSIAAAGRAFRDKSRAKLGDVLEDEDDT